MSIKLNAATNTYTVQCQKRCPKRGYSVPVKRSGIKTLAEARRVEKELIYILAERINEHVWPKLSQVIDEYCIFRSEIGHRNQTIYSYKKSFSRFMQRYLNRPINKITRQDVHDIVQTQFQNNNSYLSYFFKCCRGTFGYAIDKGYLVNDPTPYRKLVKQEKIFNVLSEKQAIEFLAKAKEQNSIWLPIWITALYTGMRSGELYALSWENVDLDQDTIKVCQSWSKKDGYKSTKSGYDRIVQIAPPLKTLLRELRLLTGGEGHVLPRLHKWDSGEQARELRMFLLGNNMTVVRFHDLRATWATVLMSKGVEPVKVMKMGGWKDLKTMMIYIRKAGIDTRGALDCLAFNKENVSNAKVIALNVEQQRAALAN